MFKKNLSKNIYWHANYFESYNQFKKLLYKHLYKYNNSFIKLCHVSITRLGWHTCAPSLKIQEIILTSINQPLEKLVLFCVISFFSVMCQNNCVVGKFVRYCLSTNVYCWVSFLCSICLLLTCLGMQWSLDVCIALNSIIGFDCLTQWAILHVLTKWKNHSSL